MMSADVLSAFSDEMQKQAFLGTLLTAPVRHVLAEGALSKGKDTVRAKMLRKALSKGDPTEIKLLADESAQGPHYVFRDGKQQVHVRKEEDPAVLAHELGHSELDRETVGSILQSTGMRTVSGLGVSAGALVGVGGKPAIGAAIAAASLLPVLTYEGMASSRGIDRMRKAGATPEEISLAKTKLLKAWGTYASLPVAVAGDVLAMHMLSRR